MHKPPDNTGATFLEVVVLRLGSILEEESKILEVFEFSRLDDVIRRKSMMQIDFLRASPANMVFENRDELLGKIYELHGRLCKNSALLNIYIGASRELSALLTEVIINRESDGTYGPALGAGGIPK